MLKVEKIKIFVTVHAKEKKSYALKGQRMLTHRNAVG
jgi:hypothetical protein